MNEISVTGLNKYFGDFHLFRDVSFTVYSGEKIALVGPNGCGKTTLLKILARAMDYDSGSIVMAAGRQIGVLEQLPDYGDCITVREVLWKAFERLDDMEERIKEIQLDMQSGDEKSIAEYGRLQTLFESAGGYEKDVAYARMTQGLKIDEDMQQRPFSSLSGGEKTRVNLARIMLAGTDILLLDEPTNHLDIQSITWLEEYIAAFKNTVILVSHDRYFLDKATNRTLELREGEMHSWPGNYSYFIDKKQEMMEQLEAAKKQQDKEIERLTFTIDRLKGWGLGNKKVMRKAFSMEKRIERMERIETIRSQKKMKNQFNQANQSGNDVYVLSNLTIGYDEPLITDFSADIVRGERIGILGPNGSGKTTLLNTILRTQPPLSGRIYEGVGIKKGYLPQNVQFNNPGRNLVDTMLFETNVSTQEARDRLASFEFKGDDVFKRVAELSGGEKTRLKLCMFMYSQVNTLFLDEPTNHLDILSREWVEDAIDSFSETIIFISHDRQFINRFATRIWEITPAGLQDFQGTYDRYVKKADFLKKADLPTPQKAEQPKDTPKKPDQRKNAKHQEKLRKELEKKIKALERQAQDIDEEIGACPVDDYIALSELTEKKQKLEDELIELYEQEAEV